MDMVCARRDGSDFWSGIRSEPSLRRRNTKPRKGDACLKRS